VKSFVADMRAAETSGEVLSISFGHGFPWADVADIGAKVWAITDADPKTAQRLAQSFGEKAFAIRESGRMPLLSMDAAIDRLAHAPTGLVVFADVADNSGGGAASDSTFILRRLIERGVKSAAFGVVWDLTAVDICRNAGVGATLALRIGGKATAQSGEPIDIAGVVRSILVDHHPVGLGGRTTPLGVSVWFEAEGIAIVLSSVRNQTFTPQMFEDHGIILAQRRVVVVKSIEHFYAAFSPLAAEILYVATPGSLRADFENIAYTRRRLEFWPRNPEPARSRFEF
jgi:microcystin degradation protein MlrC